MLAIIALIIVIVTSITLFVSFAPQFGAASKGDRLKRNQASPQFSEGLFHNKAEVNMDMPLGKMAEVLWKFLRGVENGTPSWSIPVEKMSADHFDHAADTQVRVTWFGHSAFSVEAEGMIILLDPMLGPAAAPVSFMTKRFNDTLPMSLEELPHIDAVLFSHDHYDHLDYPSVMALKDKTDHFFVPLGLGAHLAHWGVHPEMITELDWWEEATFGPFTFAATPSQHFSGRGVRDRFKTLWASWVIKGKHTNLFFGGDSGYFDGFKDIGEKYGPFDLTMLECGQYNEDWADIHMMPEETAQAHLDLKGKVLMPIHWGAFELSLHTWTEPIERVMAQAKKDGTTLCTPRIGESFVIGAEVPHSHWWVR